MCKTRHTASLAELLAEVLAGVLAEVLAEYRAGMAFSVKETGRPDELR